MSWQYDSNSGTQQWVNDGQGDSSERGRDQAERNSRVGTVNEGKYPGVPYFTGTPEQQNATKQGGKQQSAPTLPPATANNGPIFPPDPVQPISFNSGKQAYNPTMAPFGWDLSAPGVREQFWNNNQNLWFESPQLDWIDSMLPQFESPWQGEQAVSDLLKSLGPDYWEGKSGSFNNAKIAFDKMNSNMPGSLQPQFDAYYDRMKQKVMSDVNTQSAARGVYGSNSALNDSIGAGLDVEAQRAKAATDFSLEDSANQLGWYTGLSGAGRNADLSANDYDKTQLGKINSYGELAFGLDDSKRDRLSAGISTAFGSDAAHHGQLQDAFEASGDTQDAREGRIAQALGALGGLTSQTVDFFSKNYDQIISGDNVMSDANIQALIAKEADQRGWDQQTKEQIWRDVEGIIKAVKGGQSDAADAGASGAGG